MSNRPAPETELLRAAYAAFNAGDIDAVLALMTPEVEWPRACKGGFFRGPEAIRASWTEQWSEINPHVESLAFHPEDVGYVLVEVHQVVRDLVGTVVADEHVGSPWIGGFIHTKLIEQQLGEVLRLAASRNMVYLERAAELLAKSRAFDSTLLQHVSPLGWEHINLTGDYTWHTNKRVAKGGYRPGVFSNPIPAAAGSDLCTAGRSKESSSFLRIWAESNQVQRRAAQHPAAPIAWSQLKAERGPR